MKNALYSYPEALIEFGNGLKWSTCVLQTMPSTCEFIWIRCVGVHSWNGRKPCFLVSSRNTLLQIARNVFLPYSTPKRAKTRYEIVLQRKKKNVEQCYWQSLAAFQARCVERQKTAAAGTLAVASSINNPMDAVLPLLWCRILLLDAPRYIRTEEIWSKDFRR